LRRQKFLRALDWGAEAKELIGVEELPDKNKIFLWLTRPEPEGDEMTGSLHPTCSGTKLGAK
jgi:hypothetical protein